MTQWWPFRRVQPVRLDGSTMGTTYTVKFVAGRPQVGDAAIDALRSAIDECLAGVIQRMSPWRADSEVARLNSHAETSPFTLSADTFHVLEQAQRISLESGGAFDATIRPVVEFYGFGRGIFRVDLPGEEELGQARARVGHHLIELDPTTRSVRKQRPDVQCDLSGIAKGFGVDQVAAILAQHGIARYVVEIGGEVRAAGHNADGRPWQVAIERPVPETREVHQVIGLSGASMATSGDYRTCYMKAGQRVSHTIDPRSGRPVRHDVASVTVVCPTCVLADGWATALMVLGPEDGRQLAEDRGLAALFLVRRADGSFSEA